MDDTNEPDKPKKTKKTFKEIAARIKDKSGNPIDIDEVLAKKLILASLQEDADPSLVAKVHTLSARDDSADPEMREMKLLKAREEYEKSKFQRELTRGEYVPKAQVAQVLGKMYAVMRTVWLNIGPAQAGIIAAKAGSRSPEVKLEIDRILTNAAYDAQEIIFREWNDFFEKLELPTIPAIEKPEPRQPKKRKTKNAK